MIHDSMEGSNDVTGTKVNCRHAPQSKIVNLAKRIDVLFGYGTFYVAFGSSRLCMQQRPSSCEQGMGIGPGKYA